MNQSEFLAITCNFLKAREKLRVQGAIGCGFSSHWVKEWCEIFKPITFNCIRVIASVSHLKTAPSCYRVLGLTAVLSFLIEFSTVYFQSPRLSRKEPLSKKVSDTSTCSIPASRITNLILVIHGGTQVDASLDPTSRDVDFKLLQDAFEAVVHLHYRGAAGKIALRLVECPAICSKALSLLSQLCPYSESDSGRNIPG